MLCLELALIGSYLMIGQLRNAAEETLFLGRFSMTGNNTPRYRCECEKVTRQSAKIVLCIFLFWTDLKRLSGDVCLFYCGFHLCCTLDGRCFLTVLKVKLVT